MAKIRTLIRRTWQVGFHRSCVRRHEYEAQFQEPDIESSELDSALDVLEKHAALLVRTGIIPKDLVSTLASFKPGDASYLKVFELLQYKVVHHRIEFDVAESVIDQLSHLHDRVQLVAMLSMVLVGYEPSATAVKYFERATTLFLAGYETESVIMCGAVLEAALRARFPDELLREAGVKPAYKKAADFSASQRLSYEEKHGVLQDSVRGRMRELMTWRNDAVHVQPDIVPSAEKALTQLVVVLLALFPIEGF